MVNGDALELALEYNADMFHSQTAGRIAGHFLVRTRRSVHPAQSAEHSQLSRPALCLLVLTLAFP